MLIIGLDAATPSLVEQWMADGKLPAFRRLTEAGAWGPLRSVPNTSSPAAWSTFMTGKNPGRHGIIYFSERIPGSYRHRFVNGSMRDGVAFWQLLSEAGRRVGIMNVPLTFPAEAVNGFFISGMDAPDADHPQFAYPPTLMDRLRAELGGFVAAGSLSEAIGHDVVAGRYDVALQKLLDRMETRTRWAEHLIASERPDLMTVVYTETDAAAHFFWKLMDRRHPDWRADLAQRWGDGILRVYQKADEAIRRLMDANGESTVIVISDHGAGISNEVQSVTRSVLRELGLLVYENEAVGGSGGSARRGLATTVYRWVTPRLPMALRQRLHRHLPGAVASFKSEVRGRVDWSKTRAYATGGPGEVWINVKGREPEGIVAPGPEFDDLRGAVAAAFLSCVNIDTGESIVESVQMREEMYHGPYASRGPDLYVRLVDSHVRGFRLNGREVAFPRRRPINPQEAMSGGHRLNGIVMLSGPGVRAGAALAGAQLQDMAPTVLYAAGMPVPEDMDGAVLCDAFTPEHLAARPVQFTSAKAGLERAMHDFTQEEAAAVQRRLQNLGYL
jgi:predicted AlkP superfamily phosphohydrolase/phosphomutase